MVTVIGGSGLVGAHLLCELAKSEDSILASYQTESKIQKVKKVFDYYFGEISERYWEKIRWQHASVNDIISLEKIISDGDEVYHCAALVSFQKKDFHKLMKINREGTANVVHVCLEKKIKKLCHISSTAAISGGTETNVDENTKWSKSKDTSGYSISKYGAEKEVWRGINEGLNAVMVNPCLIFGSGNWNESSLTILRQIDKRMPFFPPGANAIVDARDVATCMHKLMKSEIQSERFLLIGENVSFKSLFDRIANRLNKRPPKMAVGYLGFSIARILMGIGALLVGKSSAITKETVSSAMTSTAYSNEKIKKAINFQFFSLDETIDNAVKGRIV